MLLLKRTDHSNRDTAFTICSYNKAASLQCSDWILLSDLSDECFNFSYQTLQFKYSVCLFKTCTNLSLCVPIQWPVQEALPYFIFSKPGKLLSLVVRSYGNQERKGSMELDREVPTDEDLFKWESLEESGCFFLLLKMDFRLSAEDKHLLWPKFPQVNWTNYMKQMC